MILKFTVYIVQSKRPISPPVVHLRLKLQQYIAMNFAKTSTLLTCFIMCISGKSEELKHCLSPSIEYSQVNTFHTFPPSLFIFLCPIFFFSDYFLCRFLFFSYFNDPNTQYSPTVMRLHDDNGQRTIILSICLHICFILKDISECLESYYI